MKKTLLFLILLFLTKISFGEYKSNSTDSLIHILTVIKVDTEKVDCLNTLSKNFWLFGYYDKAMDYATRALTLGKKINFKKGIANSYNNIGIINVQQGNYAVALNNYLIGLNIRTEIDDKIDISKSYINIGNVYILQGNYPAALKNYLVSLKIGEEINSSGIIANSYCSISNVYMQQGDYQEALKKLFIALKVYGKADGNGASMAYIDIGTIYAKQGNYAEALKCFSASLRIQNEAEDPEAKDPIVISNCYASIGDIYVKQIKYKEALENYMLALKFETQMNYKYGIANSDISLGKIYSNLHRPIEAKKYLNQGLQLAEEDGNKDIIKDAYGALSDMDSAMGNMNESYHYYRLYTRMKDSITNEASNTQISQLKIQYESGKKDQQIKTQELQNRVLQTRIYYSIAISFIIVSVIILLFYLRNKRKNKEYDGKMVSLELQVLKSQLNPHFISNSLISIESYIDSHAEDKMNYLNRFSLLMRGVLEGSEQKDISLEEEMQLMEHYMELEKLRLSGGLDYSIIYDESIQTDEIRVPPLITQPVIENAIWHGLTPPGKNRQLIIHHSITGNTLIVTIENNAVKEDEINDLPLPKRKSFGVKITRERLLLLKKINGKEGSLTLEILPDKSKVTIFIPLKEI